MAKSISDRARQRRPVRGVTRRSVLELAARAASVPAGVEFFAAWSKAAEPMHMHTGSTAPPEPPLLLNYKPQFFSPAEFEALQSFTEILIPTDDTPGAREAHCAEFIDFVLAASTEYAPETQAQWRQAMSLLQKGGFHDANPRSRAELVRAMSEPERNKSAHHSAYPAYRLIKRNTTFAFYTSRAGMIEALDYRGNSYNVVFPACTHPEHHEV